MIETAPSMLSEAQRSVVQHPLLQPAVVEAGAGTGKTFTIVERVAALHESGKCPADKILLLTFGRKAAAELRARIAVRLQKVQADLRRLPDCMTFHAFAWKILSAHAYDLGLSPDTAVIDDVEARVEFRKVFRDTLSRPESASCGFPLRPFNEQEIRTGFFQIAQDLKQAAISVEAFRARALHAADDFSRVGYRRIFKPRSKAPMATITEEDFERELLEEKARVETAAVILKAYETSLQARNLLTYADILLRAQSALQRNQHVRQELLQRYPVCIVDEYQDTDLLQHRFLESLYGKKLEGVMVVGDVLQSIYSFRGAHPENIRMFLRAPGAVSYPLTTNRRSKQEILDVAYATVVQTHSDALQLSAERGAADAQVVEVSTLFRGEQGEHLPAAEARVVEADVVARQICQLLSSGDIVEDGRGGREPISPKHIAVLSRTKMNVQPMTEALLRAGIPFRLVGGVGFYEAPEIRDALAWLRLLANSLDGYAITRALQSPVIGFSDAALANIAHHLSTDETALSRRILIETLERDRVADDDGREKLAKFIGLVDTLAPYGSLPLMTALQAIFEQTGLREFWDASTEPRAPQARANLSKLESLARGFATDEPGAQAADFISFMDELQLIDYDEREADVPGLDVVTISTIHAAKGLEWPIVFVLSVWPEAPNPPRLIVDPQTGALLYAESPDGSRPFHYTAVKENADETGEIHEREDDKAERKAEERRLFYVALTRARDRVFVSGLRNKPSQKDPKGSLNEFLRSIYEWLQARDWECDRPVPSSTRMRVLASPQSAPLKGVPRSAGRRIGAGMALSVPPLSYSLAAAYERCPRSLTYKLIYRLPQIGRTQQAREFSFEDGSPADLAAEDSLLNAGEYGTLLHKGLELWAADRRAGKSGKTATDYFEHACHVLQFRASDNQRSNATAVFDEVFARLAHWRLIAAEAPFTLDFGGPGDPLLVSGYIDLLALDEQQRPCVLDYKSGVSLTESHALQVALYRRAAAQVYGLPDALGFIGRIASTHFTLDPIEPASESELEARLQRVRDGLRRANTTAHAGEWCFECAYRKAPCQDYFKRDLRA